MSERIGQTLSHYRLVERIGKGGMGVVFRARDERLERDVAVKLLPEGYLDNETSRRRFRREALTLSRLNHPNIATIHDFDRDQGLDFLVMELIEGDSLAKRLHAGPFAEREVLRLGVQLADGLDAAHRADVVHRDLKPANLVVTPDGRLKILDFGLAILRRTIDESATTETKAPVAGTLPYMAPEQVTDGSLDARSDIYAAGAVLFEMVTGRRPFPYRETARLLHAILNEAPPDPGGLDVDVSEGLRAILLKSLDKDPRRRYQSAAELRVDLERLLEPSTPSVAHAPAISRTTRRWPWVALVVAASVLAVVALQWRGGPPGIGVPVMTAVVTGPGEENGSRISPDGRSVSYQTYESGRGSVWVRGVSGGEARELVSRPGTIVSHTWSPDGTRLACMVLEGDDVLLQIVPSEGGPPLRSTRLDPRFVNGRLVRWIGSNLYIEEPSGGLWRRNLASGEAEQLIPAATETGSNYQFDVCGDESRIAYTVQAGASMSLGVAGIDGRNARRLSSGGHSEFTPRWLGPRCRDLVFSSTRGAQVDLWHLSLEDMTRNRITFSNRPEYAEDTARDGSMLTFRQNHDTADLWMLDPAREETAGRQLTADSLQDFWPSVAASGALVAFQRNKPSLERTPSLFRAEILLGRIRADALVGVRPAVHEGGAVRISPDGTRLAYVREPSGPGYELWIDDIRTGHRRRVSERFALPALYMAPLDWVETNVVWSDDGTALYFVAIANGGGLEIRRLQPVDDTTETEIVVLEAEADHVGNLHLSPDGRRLAYARSRPAQPAKTEIRSRDLLANETTTLLSEDRAPTRRLLPRGWLDDDHVLTLRSHFREDWTERVEILSLARDGRTESLGSIDRAFGGTARLDRKSRTMFVTARDTGAAHNVYAFDLRHGRSRRLSNNEIPGVTYSGLELLPDGDIVYSRVHRNENVWLIRFERNHRSKGGTDVEGNGA